MQDTLYRDIILEHWQHPQNYGVIKNPDIDVEENNPYCGDIIRLTIKLESNKLTSGKNVSGKRSASRIRILDKPETKALNMNNKVKEVAFTGEGCAISKASASLFTEEIKGKTITELKAIKPQFVLDLIGVPLSPTRAKCALLIYQVLQQVLQKGLNKKISI